MGATEQSIRGAAFGGFNRQDVMRYIETYAKEHSSRMAAAKSALEAETAARVESARQLASAKLHDAESTSRAQRAEEQLLISNGERNAARTELEEKRIRLTAAERELADLRGQVSQMAPAAIAYEGLKDRAATIELEAHQRAQSIVSAAESSAETTRAQLAAWVEKVRSSYTRLCADVSATLTHADGELTRAQHSLEGVSSEFSDHDSTLNQITVAYQSGVIPAAQAKHRDDAQ